MIQDNNILANPSQVLIKDLRQIIDSARGRVASTANYELTMMYWHIGKRINCEVLDGQRAEYGKQIVSTVSRQLQGIYGAKGFEPRSIRRMMQFASKFPDEQIVSTLSTKLSWSHSEKRWRHHSRLVRNLKSWGISVWIQRDTDYLNF